MAFTILIWVSLSTQASLGRIDSLQAGRIDPLQYANALTARHTVSHPKEWTLTAELLARHHPEETALSVSLLQRALENSPDDAHSWALLSFLEKKKSGAYTQDAEASLRRSFDVCPYCDRDLLRWRFTFVLDNWEAASEDSKLAAFSGADFLRWWYLDYDFLHQVREASLARQIPFDTYRRKIDTPVRPQEIES
ncbi:MAG: hypothetical protein AAGA89_00280 [Pseudomonadota bacterium]